MPNLSHLWRFCELYYGYISKARHGCAPNRLPKTKEGCAPSFFEALLGGVAGLGPAVKAVFDKYKEGDNFSWK
ncbi:hypothetical protein K469DRAFT_717660 [Zopfia rhizophila CBS 207.26]|uniref:Uncharacterized protein n=1 Tax=Zopfia rhizophila CBS 207.26 TaxID=1314779 RepID=A0A6A6DND8_9PEZI|nr:hypothetical protein K469DRAFT_717660 [Zopfia rhizophila CBS 207.26]